MPIIWPDFSHLYALNHHGSGLAIKHKRLLLGNSERALHFVVDMIVKAEIAGLD